MFGLAGGIGLLIAAIGIYGVVSFGVIRRTPEIGLRIAVGARREQVLIMILLHGLRLSSIGVFLGVVVALPAARVASSLLYGIAPSDPWTFILVPMCLLAVALVSSLLPASRAARLDPVTTLKYE